MRYITFHIYILVLITLYSGCSNPQKIEAVHSDLLQYVDPYIGTGFHGHVFLGANVPFGAVQLGPTNATHGWDWCSGYHYSDSTLVGFAHTHLSGTGIGDLGDILFMPVSGPLNISRGTVANPDSGYIAFYKHEDEKTRPGYYAVDIDRYDIQAELTASSRVGFHKYTFPDHAESRVIIDLESGIGWDKPTETYLEVISDTLLVGYRYSKGWAKDQRIYFAAIFSNSIVESNLFERDTLVEGVSFVGKATKAALRFGFDSTSMSNEVLIKVGISPVSSVNAIKNITSEIPHWDFEKTVSEAGNAWNQELNKAQIETVHEKDMHIFYTALYHTMIAPSVFNDTNGDYRGTDNLVRNDTSFTNLTTFSLWDTYRAAHPLYTLLQGDKVNSMINSMLRIYEQQGKLPVWHLMGNETNTMVGYSAIPVVVDAYMKGFRGFDIDLAYEAVKNTAMLDERGISFVKELGFIPADSINESVAMGLEYAISDWCVAEMAKQMNYEEDFIYFSQRANNYQNYFDSETRFMRGRLSAEKWRDPFDPIVSSHRNDDFCEGNAWQYLWLVPHDVEGLIKLLGGDEAFLAKLDSTFTMTGDMGEKASNDITGLIGLYAHGNEPGHHIPYLYSYAGVPSKTAEKVRYILDNLYSDRPDGLSGNEDVGQMSSWYVLSALGFYPVNPANGQYVFGSPIINKATIHLDNGNTFNMLVKNNNDSNIYIQEIKLNGQIVDKSFLTHSEIMKGGKLIITMGNQPEENWGKNVVSRPMSVAY